MGGMSYCELGVYVGGWVGGRTHVPIMPPRLRMKKSTAVEALPRMMRKRSWRAMSLKSNRMERLGG